MKGHQIALGHIGGREVAALITDGVLQDLLVEGVAPPIGTIYRAKATRPVKGQGGMFFDTPDGSAFLRGAKGLRPGDSSLVQVTGYAEPGKAIPVSDRLLLKSRFAIATPGAPGINISRAIKDDVARVMLHETAAEFEDDLRGCGLILRSAAAASTPDDIAQDIQRVLDAAFLVMDDSSPMPEKLFEGADPHEIAWRDWPGASPAIDPVDDHVAEAARFETPLPGGGSMIVESTRACVTVDVNTGRDTSPAAGLKSNLGAAKDLARVLRIKGLGGQIVVDFAPMPKRDRRAVEGALRAAFKSDDVETSLVGWTALGHFELSRKRARVPLQEILE